MLAVYSENFEACHRFEPAKKDTRGNHHGVLFYFEPRRRLFDNFHTQSISPLGPQHGHQVRHPHPEGQGAHQTFKVDRGPVAKRGV